MEDAPAGFHREVRHVPGPGIEVWASPDPAQPPVGSVAGGTEVTVVGRRGQWVHVQGPEGLDAWADGSALAGIAVGASAATQTAPAATPSNRVERAPVAVDKQRSPFTVGTAPVIGALGALLAIVGAALPWLQRDAAAGPSAPGTSFSAFDIPVSFLTDWNHLPEGGFSLGALLVIVAAVGLVLSLLSGGGIIRRILGIALVVIAVVYVLQWQDFLSSGGRGVGTGLNVWDIVDYGVLVTFGGGIVMIVAPSR